MGELKGIPELFEGRHFDREVIILCVRCYLRFKHLVSRTPRCQATDRCDWSLSLRAISGGICFCGLFVPEPCGVRSEREGLAIGARIHPNQPFAAAPTNDRIEEMVPLVRTAAQGAIRSFSG